MLTLFVLGLSRTFNSSIAYKNNFIIHMTNFNNTTHDTRNNLALDRYIIDETLYFSLESGKLHNYENSLGINKFYLIMVRVLNKDSKILVYNYISYPYIFYYTFLVFIATRNKYSSVSNHIHRQAGDFLSIFDDSLDTSDVGDKLFISKNTMDLNKIIGYICRFPYTITNVDAFKIINRLILQVNMDSMSHLTFLALNNQYKVFIKEVLSTLNDHTDLVKDLNYDGNIKPLSIINGCLFVVGSIEDFVESVRKYNYNINAGPQQHRGQVNSINNSLSILDFEYRKSLYNHNNYHVIRGNVASIFKLNRDKFSFNNIHMNIGGVRWSSSISSVKPNNRDDLLEFCFKEISDILVNRNRTSLTKLQMEIENKLFEGQKWFSENYKPKDKISYNSKTYDYLAKNKIILNKLLSNPDKFSGNTKTHGTEYIPWFKKILDELGFDSVSDMLIQYFLYIVTNESITIDDVETPGIPSILCYNNFGRRVVDRYFYSKYSRVHNQNQDLTLSEFKNNDVEFKEVNEDDNFNARVGGFFIYALIECQLLKLNLDQKSDEYYKYQEYVRLTDISRNVMVKDANQSIFHLPSKLPMICPPKEYSLSNGNKKPQLGGYLLNDIKYVHDIFIEKVGYGKPTVLKDINIIIDLINGFSKTPYKVNTDTLKFIYEYGIDKNIIIDIDKDDIKNIINNPYKATNKKLGRQYRSIVSKINLEKNILNIAELYSNINEIYFPVRMDNRTRVYCITDYFDYQKNDLAKGLISFSKPGKLYKTDQDVIKYFKAFGANMFGNNLDKKSLNYRVDWIDNNRDIILDFENNDIVNRAENKSCFVSFCFEYKRFIEFMNNNDTKIFYSYLPIQLDATCNGYQHLTLLTREKNLFDVLNLASSTHDDDPDDFYTYILKLTISYMKNKKNILSNLKDKTEQEIDLISSYDKLLKVVFDRTMVKRTIMTKSYNASIPKQVSQLLSNLEEVYDNRSKYYIYKNNTDVKFKRTDIVAFVMVIKNVIAKESPRITELSKYLDGIVSICTKLNIPVPWALPSGAEILESYEVVKSKTIKAFFFVNTRYTFKRYQRGLYDLDKQKRATMPNLIHSLDATTIAILYNNFKNIGPLYTIHDCFGVTANNVPRLILKLKLTYIQLYSSTTYLMDFDTFVKTTINKTCGDSVYKIGDNFVYIPNKKNNKVSMPDIKSVLDKSIDINCLKQSANIIV